VTIIFILICVFLATMVQAAKRNKKYQETTFTRTQALRSRPHIKGIVDKLTTMSPKKPNSATRHVAKVKLSNFKKVTARLPGRGYHCSRYNRVLVEGGRANDLPGVGYSLRRGVYDFSPMVGKRKRRSIYGVSRPDRSSTHIRRCFRTPQQNV
jgi:small subunit ribosomal protein S12